MTSHWGLPGWLQLATVIAIIAIVHVPLGDHMARVYTSGHHTSGTLSTHTPMFVALLSTATLIIVGLEFFPALALGPLAEGVH